jgi:hypothetical protein
VFFSLGHVHLPSPRMPSLQLKSNEHCHPFSHFANQPCTGLLQFYLPYFKFAYVSL